MDKAMQDEKQDLEWGKFWARIFAGLGLGTMGVIVSHMIVEDAPSLQWGGIGALAGTVVAFGFILAKFRRGDEMDRAIDRVTSVQAGLFTIGMIIVQNLMAQMGWVETEAIPVYSMPGFFILYKTMIAQYLRASLAEGKETAGVASLRP